MARSSSALAFAPDEVLEITRSFAAPPELLFKLWSDPAHRVRWWGPEGHGLSHLEMDFRVGGAWRMAMRDGTGHEHWVRGAFTEIDAPRRLAFTYINEEDGHEMLVQLDFVAEGAETRMDFVQAPFKSLASRDAHSWGWTSTLDLLADYARLVDATAAPVGAPRGTARG